MGCAWDRVEQGEGTVPTNWMEVDEARGIGRAIPRGFKMTDGDGTVKLRLGNGRQQQWMLSACS